MALRSGHVVPTAPRGNTMSDETKLVILKTYNHATGVDMFCSIPPYWFANPADPDPREAWAWFPGEPPTSDTPITIVRVITI